MLQRGSFKMDDMMNDIRFIEDEIERIYAETAQGEQSVMVQRDMKQWAEQEGWWPQMDYIHMIAAHGVARGWTQNGFDEMEIVQ